MPRGAELWQVADARRNNMDAAVEYSTSSSASSAKMDFATRASTHRSPTATTAVEPHLKADYVRVCLPFNDSDGHDWQEATYDKNPQWNLTK